MPGDFSGGGAAFAGLRPAMHSWHTALTLPPDTTIPGLMLFESSANVRSSQERLICERNCHERTAKAP